MRRMIATLAVAVVAVSFSSSANAGLFHKHNACCEPAPVSCCAPAPVCEAAPVSCCDVDPCAKPARKHHLKALVAKIKSYKLSCKTSCCEPAPSCCEPVAPTCDAAPAPVCDAAPAPACDAAPVSCCEVDPCAKPSCKDKLNALVAKIKSYKHSFKLSCCKPAVSCCEPVAPSCCN